MTTAIDRAHPALQIAIRKWLELRLPDINRPLAAGIETPDGLFTADEVAFHMTNAALEVLKVAISARGLGD